MKRKIYPTNIFYFFFLGPCAYNPDKVNTSISHSFGVKHKDDHIDLTPGKLI